MEQTTRRWTHYVFGSRTFYAAVFAIVLPIIVQNSISAFVSLLDNIMVGQTTKELMSGVSIANSLVFVFNVCVFGGISGASIFGAQFFGAKDYESVRAAMRFKLYVSVGLFVLATATFLLFGRRLMSFFLAEGEAAGSVAATLSAGRSYLYIMLAGLLPFAISQTYTSTLREAGETVLPMISSIAAVLTNLALNYILIFGHLGAPRMGASGAALATVISRFLELSIILVGIQKNRTRYFYLHGVYRSLRVPMRMVKRIVLRGLPLLANETLWSLGTTFLAQLYAMRGLNVVAGMNISTTVANLFTMIIFSMGTAIAIMVGQALGANEIQRAKETAWRLISVCLMLSLLLGAILAGISSFIPRIYNLEENVRALATDFMRILALAMPVMAFAHCCYFTLRSGGKTLLTFAFDSLATWLVSVPIVYLMIHHTHIDIRWVYLAGQLTELPKCILGFFLVRRGVWIHNITGEATAADPVPETVA